ncbi:hypothetical protein [Enhydrobacter sp.]|jgi:hypothetical protein|uniref:hypothetical protein n=1 Tax=Enhydrobacter sp. TaxID=1894999 RepID=UPI0026360C7D|nr:hypothetical protein [Enhydrobacter sp.]WIM12663.1 MAG: hypothetical protein OJF58_003626 [Enhydrobacter sp.]
MADTTAHYGDLPADASVPPEEMRAHRRSYLTFERLILFSVLHIALVLVCLALAFLGDVPLIAFLLGVAGTLVMFVGFVVRGTAPA